ncbi:hypothetical protein AAV33_01970 [Corynebacterium otitidis]|nr:hypothetical protein AAV33_01970 [Corynebacterium otitidis]
MLGFRRLIALLGALALALSALVASNYASAEGDPQRGYGEPVPEAQPVFPEGVTSNENGSSNMFNLVLLPDGMGYGWCVDPGTPSPTQNDVEFTGPVKLTHVKPLLTADRAPWGPNFEEMSQPVEFQNEGVRRDAVIHVVKELRKALDARDQDRVKKLHQALQLLIGSYVGQMLTNLGRTATGSTDYGWAIDNEFLEGETGFRAVGASDGVLEYTGNSTEPIPEADPDEFITIASPVDYDVTDNGPRRNSAQRTVLIDQPGLKEEDDEEEETSEPSESEEPTPSTTSPSEEPVPEREPSIGTTAEFGEDSEQVVVAGSVVTDSVEYQDLVPNTDYRLEASLVDKQDESRVLGTASKDVRTGDESDGVFTIDIPVDDDVVEPVESAVVFERLVSDVVDASGAESDEDGNVIAVHEDIDDEGQTVVSEETPSGSPSEPGSEEPAPSTNPSKPEKGEQPRKVEISTNAKLAPGEELVEGATVIDEVHFEGLTPGKKYTLEGELICKATEEPTGAKESIDFVAIESEGSIKLPIKVTDGECGEQVVFETLRDSDGEVIATHHDVDDEAQTVTHEDEAKPKDESEEPVDDEPEGENVTFLVDDRPEVGIPSAPNAERQEITSVPTGSDRLAPGIPAYV